MTFLSRARDSLSLPVAILRLVAAISRLARAYEAATEPLARMAGALEDNLKLDLLRRGASLETLRAEYDRVVDLENHPEKAAAQVQDFGRVAGDMDLLYSALAAVPPGSFEEQELTRAALGGASPAEIARLVQQHGIRTGPEAEHERRVEEAGGRADKVRVEDLPNSVVLEGDVLGGATFGEGER